MEGLIREAEEIMGNCEDGAMRDAGIIAAAQKVECCMKHNLLP